MKKVGLSLLPAVFLQQLHKHGALFGFALLFLCSLLLRGSRPIIMLIVLFRPVVLREIQLELRILPERFSRETN